MCFLWSFCSKQQIKQEFDILKIQSAYNTVINAQELSFKNQQPFFFF